MKVDLLAMYEVLCRRLPMLSIEMRVTNPNDVRFDYWDGDSRIMCRSISLLVLERSKAGIEFEANCEADRVWEGLRLEPNRREG